ncbi:hypothetical protein [Maribacter sp. 2308TA10-17]|uniref:hypothetical protein n=1 Tax=Maribacter sp. 2308TA10-17 TaxID=3386276 RepID=UPI0039BD03DB
MTPYLFKKQLIMFCFSLFSLGILAQVDSLQQSVTEKGIEQWQDGLLVLSNGKQYFGQIKCVIKSGTLLEHIEFRKDATDFSQIFMAETCDEIQWGEFELISLPKDFKKPLDKMFYLNMYQGNNIQVFFEPKFTKSSKPESLRFLVYKEGIYTSVTKAKFKRTTFDLFGDSALWRDKTIDKDWFKFSNMYEVAKFYDSNIVFVNTRFED